MRPALMAGNPAATLISGGESPEAYTTGAVHFDGASWLVNNALATGAASRYFAMSVWFKWDSETDAADAVLFAVDPDGVYMPWGAVVTDPINLGKLYLRLSAGLELPSDQAVPADGWHHIIFAVDTNFGPDSKLVKVYVDDVDVTDVNQDQDEAFAIALNGLKFVFGGDSYGGDGSIGDAADAWFALGQNLLVAGDIPEATRRKFISALGKPVDLGADGSTPTGTAPAIFLRRAPAAAASTFANNLGTGGPFVEVGTLTNANTSPSD